MALFSFALVATAFASNANKEFKGSDGNGNGKASGNDNSVVNSGTNNSSAPGGSDIVKVAHGKKVDVDAATVTWGAVEFTGGSILAGTSTNTLNLLLTTSTWTGGEIDSSTINSAGMAIGSGGDDAKSIKNGGKLKLSGTTTWTGDSIGISAAATLENNVGATFSTNFDGTITNDGSAGGVTNAGTFTKSAGSGGATDIQTAFTNTGSVNASSGTLLLSGGGTSSAGTITVGSGAKLKTNGNNFDFTGGVLNSASDGSIEVAGAITTFSGTSGSANLTVNGGTAKLNGNHSGTGKLTLSSGKLDASTAGNTATVSGLDWSGGEVSTATVTVGNTGTNTISGATTKKLNGGAKLNLGGTTTQSSDLSTGGAAEINNSGTFTLSGGSITHGEGGTIASFKNNGSFAKTNAGTSQVDAFFDNTGSGASVAVNGGTLQLTGGGSSNKGVSVADASSLQLGTTDFTFSGGALNTTGTGSIDLTSATTTFGGTTGSANLSVSGAGATAKINGSHSTTGKLTLSGGKVNGASTSDVATVGSLDWSIGEVSSSTVTTSGTTTISGVGSKKLNGGAKLNVGGTTTLSGDLSTGGAAEISNTGTFNLSGGSITHGEGGTIATFKNNGAFNKSTAGTAAVDAYFDNTGASAAVAVNAGTLQLTGGGSSNQGVSVADASSLQLGTTDFTFSGGALNTTGTGSIDLTSATTTFGGTTGSANLSVSGASATAKINGSHATTGKLTLSGGKVNANAAGDTASVGSLDWSTGEITTATVATTGTTNISGAGAKKLNGGAKLNVGGTTNVSSDLSTGGAAEINNTGTFNIASGSITHGEGGALATFKNNGAFNKGNSGTTQVDAYFDNTGGSASVAVNGGTLQLTAGGNSNKGVSIADTATLQLGTTDFTFSGGALNTTGTGSINLTSATTTFGGTTGSANLQVSGAGATAKINGSHSTSGKLTLSGGKVNGTTASDVATVGSLDWSTGEVSSASVTTSGATTIGGAGAKKLNGGAKLNVGGATTQSSDLSTGGGAEINNTGTFTISSGNITHGEGGALATFKNNGAFNKANGGTTQVDAFFDNTGGDANVAVNGGTLQLTGGGNSNKGVSIADNSKLDLGTTNFTFSGGALNTTGTGVIDLTSATTTFGGTTGNANLSVSGAGATAKINGAHSTSGKLSLSGGKVNGTTASDVATVGSFDWSTGEVSSASVTTTGTTTIGGIGAKKLNGGAKLNVGGATTQNSDLSTGGAAEINNTGTFTIQGGNITHGEGGALATFKNNGAFNKANAGTTTVDAYFDNTGNSASLAVDGGKLKLTAGGNSNKGVSIADTSTLELGTTDFTFSGGALNTTGSGVIDLTGATTTFGGTTGNANLSVSGAGATAKINGSHATSGKLTLSGGKVNANAAGDTASVGSFDWTIGEVSTATVATTGAVNISGAGAKKLNGGGKLNVGGTTTLTGADLSTGGAAEINNTGTFTIDGGNITHGEGGTLATFKNNGAFNKANAGTTSVDAYFDNTGANGSVNVNGGKLKLTAGGNSNKGVSIADASTLELGTTDFTFSGGALNTTGAGSIDLTSATTTFGGTTGNANLSVSGAGATAKINGSHSTSGKLTLSGGKVNANAAGDTASVGSFDWTTGEVSTATVATTGTVNIGNGGAKKLNGGAKLNVGGNTTQNADLSTGGAAEINNTGTFTITDGNITHGEGGALATFKNNGSFKKSNAGTTAVDAFFDNTGNSASLAVDGGKLKLTGGGNSNKGVSVADNGTLELGTTDFTFSGGALNTTGSGVIDLTGATTTFGGTTGNANISVSGAGAVAKINGSHSGTGKLTLSGGKVNANAAGDTASVGSFDWTIGEVSTATVTTNGVVNISGAGSKKLNSSGKLKVGGTTNVSGADLSTGGGAEIENTGDFTLGGGSITHGEGGALATFKNNGSFKKSNVGSSDIDASFENDGASSSVSVDGGTLRLVGGGHSSKNVNVGNGAKLQVATSDYAFNGGALDGAGTIDLSGAVTTFNGTSGSAKLTITGGTARFNGNHNGTGKLTFSSGSIDGGATATLGGVDWTGGDLSATTLDLTGSSTISGAGAKRIKGAGKLKLSDTAWTGGTIDTGEDAAIENGGVFATDFDGIIANSLGGNRGKFKNTGTFNKNAGGGDGTDIQTIFDNDGTVNVNSGKLKLTGGGKNGANGKIAVAALAQLEISSDLDLDALSELKGNGLAKLLNGKLNANGAIAIANFIFDGGELQGTNHFTGTVDWNNGHWNSLTAGAVTTIDAGSILNLNASNHEFNNRSIHNRGIVNWQAGNLRGGNGSDFLNDANGVFNDLNKGNKSLQAPGGFGGSASFTNNGTYHKQGDGQTTIDVLFTNNNAVNVDAGTLRFTDTFHQTGGSLFVAAGATAKFDNGLNFDAGTLSGSGTLDGNVVSAGTLNPGSSPGTMSITGSLTLAINSVAVFEIGGLTQGVTYDFVSVGGATVLGGTLQLKFYNGFNTTVQASDVFTILNASGGLSGAFGNVADGGRLFAVDNGGSFLVHVNDPAFGLNSIVLSNFAPIPEPSTWALMLGGLAVFGWKLRRRRR